MIDILAYIDILSIVGELQSSQEGGGLLLDEDISSKA